VHKNGLVYPFTYLYGPDGQLLGEVEYLSSGRKKRAQYFVWLDGLPLAALELSYTSDGSIANSKTTYLHAGHLNTPRLATNQSGQLVWSWQSDAFGVGTANTDVDGDGIPTDIPLRFPGQIADIHSSLHYNYFRDYDPETGRYVESDPIGLDGVLNTYGYVMGNPTNATDPMGLDTLYIYNGPTFPANGNNPFGHSGVAPEGQGIYSYGNSTTPGSSTTDYLKRQSAIRDTAVVIIPTTKEQEASMGAYFGQYPDPNQGINLTHTCAARLSGAFVSAGLMRDQFVRSPQAYGFPYSQYSEVKKIPGAQVMIIPKGGEIPPELDRFNPRAPQ
jgi:RHS repeat-associated protein